MATCVIAENPKLDAERFGQILQQLRAGDFPPEGMIFQAAGQADNGWRVVTIWQSREAFDRFVSARLAQVWADVGVNRDDVTFTIFETHSLVAGDLSSVPQPVASGTQT
jgi:hypothetical protein